MQTMSYRRETRVHYYLEVGNTSVLNIYKYIYINGSQTRELNGCQYRVHGMVNVCVKSIWSGMLQEILLLNREGMLL